ncbi:hypothetical protein [Bradyrhizobium sp. NAS96.2]|uniref:hypothetical protein n=1 Tax=Bradyrhizobium sp. NAS96.2 TaxID=1680160 RepID=UPI001161462B|nr:hypothetical protein [Bradyrhizobium sp. NAS96.2]
MFGATVSHLAKRATEARWEADVLACQAWNARMLAFQGLPSTKKINGLLRSICRQRDRRTRNRTRCVHFSFVSGSRSARDQPN